jgi:RNA polymerase sigma-70 factor (ECF subfamily)
MPSTTEQESLPVKAAREGDPEAWDTLFRRYQLPLYCYVREWVHDEQTALDLVQEVMVSAVRHLATLRDNARFGSWLFGIAHQKCIQHWRKRRLPLEPLEADDGALADPRDDPAESLVRQEQEEHFMHNLSQLPEHHRAVLMLHFLEGFSLAEIANITGVGLGTVKSRMHYAKQALRQGLEEE